MKSLADLAELIETETGLSVVPPGTVNADLPCVVLTGVGLEIPAGFRYVMANVGIAVVDRATPYADQHAANSARTVEVLRALAGTEYALETDVPLEMDPVSEPPTLFHTITVTFPTASTCPETE